ncbi:hypothetical protein [Maridesulfovibrio sp.]|uniref:hypothetical protein n=1 Tax=Maridesulfovibrio sp. TaxID=2795000 RepID=UPI0029C9C2F0|nr:hypothetical protein [Maridesulfovibrio sp.]
MNRRQRIILTVILAFSVLMSKTAMAKDIVIFNETDFEIHGVYMSSAEDKLWGANLLEDDVLRPGEGLRISVSGTPEDLDLALIDDEDQELALMELDFREFDSLTLFNDGTGRFD